ncbi:unnamed protein product [Penicillium pancosmium]
MAMIKDPLVYHYLDIGRLGRGEVVNLFLKDAGVEFKTVLYPWDATWPQQSETLKNQGLTRTGKLPALEYKGDMMGKQARRNILWTLFRTSILIGDEKKPEYKDKYVPEYYRLVAQYYSDFEGPYLLGDKITYVDFAIYQSIDNDRRTGTLPSVLPEALLRFKEVFEKRPRITDYIKQNE